MITAIIPVKTVAKDNDFNYEDFIAFCETTQHTWKEFTGWYTSHDLVDQLVEEYKKSME